MTININSNPQKQPSYANPTTSWSGKIAPLPPVKRYQKPQEQESFALNQLRNHAINSVNLEKDEKITIGFNPYQKYTNLVIDMPKGQLNCTLQRFNRPNVRKNFTEVFPAFKNDEFDLIGNTPYCKDSILANESRYAGQNNDRIVAKPENVLPAIFDNFKGKLLSKRTKTEPNKITILPNPRHSEQVTLQTIAQSTRSVGR